MIRVVVRVKKMLGVISFLKSALLFIAAENMPIVITTSKVAMILTPVFSPMQKQHFSSLSTYPV